MTDFVSKVKEFNEIAGNANEYNVRKAALYIGLITEELDEMLQAAGMGQTLLTYHLQDYSAKFKAGVYDNAIDVALTDRKNRVEFLDAAVDIAVVSLGAGIAVGGDVDGATHAVADNNLSKFPIIDGKRTVLRDANGKVAKPEGFKPVELSAFVK